jgi:uncharacterized damage-inducible protein DinB
VGGQQTFVLRTRGQHHLGEWNRGSGWPGIDELARVARSTSEELLSIAESFNPEQEVELPYRGKTYRYPVRFFLVHAVEHGVEHRTEIKVGLNQLGIETPDLDGWPYAEAAGYGREVEA